MKVFLTVVFLKHVHIVSNQANYNIDQHSLRAKKWYLSCSGFLFVFSLYKKYFTFNKQFIDEFYKGSGSGSAT